LSIPRCPSAPRALTVISNKAEYFAFNKISKQRTFIKQTGV
jgi:hypothetical protein